MSKAAFTIKAFGLYLIALGLALAIAPNLLLSSLGMPQTTEVWIRVLGVAVLDVGVCYWAAARGEAVLLFRASVYMRSVALVCFSVFVLLGTASAMLLLFGFVDAAGAFWTWLALRSQQRDGQRVYPVSRIDPLLDSRM